MAKRKRSEILLNGTESAPKASKKAKSVGSAVRQPVPAKPAMPRRPVSLQIIAGSYDRILHGITAQINTDDSVSFADTFLFTAHTSALRCLALSEASAPVPGQTQKVLLASGSNDERINVYNLSAHPPKPNKDRELLSAAAPRPILENRRNRELGTLMHHSSSVTAMSFPTRSKLLTASEDSSIGVTRTRDWQLLSTIKVPIPKAQGRPSGDTAPHGGTPSGVNDFAMHPSMKLMISVSKGEKCMRLWNLLTGKKAGVLNFGKNVLREAGEGKHSTGEGRSVDWGATQSEGDEFAVAFDRDVVVFGMDSLPRCRAIGHARTKVHKSRYFVLSDTVTLLALSTEDGRVLFFSTERDHLDQPTKDNRGQGGAEKAEESEGLPCARLIAQIGGRDAGITGRIKDFVILPGLEDDDKTSLYVVGGSSDGKIRLWRVNATKLLDRVTIGEDASAKKLKATMNAGPGSGSGSGSAVTPSASTKAGIGKLLGTYESQNRITCLEGFVMIPRPEGVDDSEDDGEEEEDDGEGKDDSDDEDD